MATLDIGKLKFTFKGAFATSTTYEKDDVVSFGGSSWIYVNATSKTGTAAGNPTHQIQRIGILWLKVQLY